MALPIQIFTLTPEQFKGCAAKLLSEHQISVDVTQPSGVIQSHGAKVGWTYNGTTLTVQILSKPFVFPEHSAQALVADFFKV